MVIGIQLNYALLPQKTDYNLINEATQIHFFHFQCMTMLYTIKVPTPDLSVNHTL